MNNHKDKNGFTMIELLVVIAIIGLLSTLGIVALNNARMKARDSRRVTDISKIQTALEMYYSDHGKYPSVVGALGTTIDLGGVNYKCLDENGFSPSCSGQIYMAEVPSYPKPRTDVGCQVDTAGYYYKSHTDTDASTYRIQYCLGGSSGVVPAHINYACEGGVFNCSW